MTRSRDLITLDEARQRAAISPDECRALLGLSRNAMYSALCRGDVESLRIGGRIVIPVPALLALLGEKP